MGSKLFKKKRGKFDVIREERKNKRDAIARDNAIAKKRKLSDGTAIFTGVNFDSVQPEFDTEQDYVALESAEQVPSADTENVFYGLLDSEEQAYYANVNTKITTDDFESDEDRNTFIEAVYRESQGKELKLASSQSCSRHLEKLIAMSNTTQLLNLFESLLPGLVHLTQHRFGSHVLEALFQEAARHCPPGPKNKKTKDLEPGPIESCFLKTAELLEPNMGYMLTDVFASHTIRILLLVLSGQAVVEKPKKKQTPSKKKEKIALARTAHPPDETSAVPKSFKRAVHQLLEATVSTLDGTYLRALATHPTGSPVLQVILKIELMSSDKGRQLEDNSVYRKLLSPDEIGTDSEGDKFVSGLTYDPTGSHLIEVLAQHAPGKVFKRLYRNVWKEKLTSMAKNEVASYVAIRILERLGQQDLVENRGIILQETIVLLQRRRFNVLRTLIERTVARRADLEPMAKELNAALDNADSSLLTMLLYPSDIKEPSKNGNKDRAALQKSRVDTRGSVLAQGMLATPYVCTRLQNDLTSLNDENLRELALDPSGSRVLQSALTSGQSPTAFRKQLIPRFEDHIAEFGTNQYGSFIVDSMWRGTRDLHFIKERLAETISEHETQFRESSFGRSVWRNWDMDIYQRRFGEWQAKAKGFDVAAEEQEEVKKTPLQLARERHAIEKAKRGQNGVQTNKAETA